jgi:GT2 family glycosyltransferase
MISFIIVTWNSKDWLPDYLNSLYQLGFSCEVIIIDQGSTDGSREYLEQIANAPLGKSLRMRIETVPIKISWTEANDLGICMAKGEWLAISNPDIIFNESFKWLDTTRHDCILVPQLINKNDGRRQHGNRNLSFSNLAHLSTTLMNGLNRFIGRGYIRKSFYSSTEHPRMSFFMVHQSQMAILGWPWSEGYTWARADSDLCLRANRAGVQILLEPRCRIVHGYGTSNKSMGSAFLDSERAYGTIIFARHWNLYPRILAALYFLNAVPAIIAYWLTGRDSLTNMTRRVSDQLKSVLTALRTDVE